MNAGNLFQLGHRRESIEAHLRLLGDASMIVGRPDWLGIIPGRIEVLGKHTDYCGGQSLLCATDQAIHIAARAIDEPVLKIDAPQVGGSVTIALDAEQPPAEAWAIYPFTVVRRLRKNFGRVLEGLHLAIVSDLPPAAGMSSSSAMIIATFLALAERSRLTDHPLYREHLSRPEDLAHYLGCIENGSDFGPLIGEPGVGTSGGSQDHAAILCGKPGELSRFEFSPIRHVDDVALPGDLTFVIAVSGVVAEKTGAARDAYNAVSRRARDLLGRYNMGHGTQHETVRDLADAIGNQPLDDTPDAQARFDQFRLESMQLIPQATAALTAGDFERFGDLVDQSQAAAVVGLGNQVEETRQLATSARELGAIAASAFGAGFGGSVWALVRSDEADAFLERWRTAYTSSFSKRKATFITTHPAPAAWIRPCGDL